MFISPLLASLVSFAMAAFLVEVTRKQRRQATAVHTVILILAVALSVFLAAYVSSSPEVSGGHLFYLWIGYTAINLLFRRRREKRITNASSEALPE
jgi:uncharacterized membrane protein YoaK (UPF0700 family)